MILKDLCREFQVFLFDFDGLLVDTENIHLKAFKQLLASEGFELTWNLQEYVSAAHFSSEGLMESTFSLFPELKSKVRDWKTWYAQKKTNYISLLENGVELMPGAQNVLTYLKERKMTYAVVTHSPLDLIEKIRQQHKCLQEIPHWITRHDYHLPKPNPECYLLAKTRLADKESKVIGFEDSPRGIQALIGAGVKPVWVSPEDHPGKDSIHDSSILHFESLEDILR